MRKYAFVVVGSLVAIIALVAFDQFKDPKGSPKSTTASSPSSSFTSPSKPNGPTLQEVEERLSFEPLFRIDVSDRALLALGKEVYFDSCAACHGASLQGQPNWRNRDAEGNLPAPPHDLTGHTWHHSDEVLFNLVKHGPGFYTPDYSGKMPAYEALLTDRDIRAVNSWIASTWPQEILLAQRERTLASEQPQ